LGKAYWNIFFAKNPDRYQNAMHLNMPSPSPTGSGSLNLKDNSGHVPGTPTICYLLTTWVAGFIPRWCLTDHFLVFLQENELRKALIPVIFTLAWLGKCRNNIRRLAAGSPLRAGEPGMEKGRKRSGGESDPAGE
jgi:hypothetical protein